MPDIFDSLVHFCVVIEGAEDCFDHRVLRLLLERATHLKQLMIYGEIDNADAAFADVCINAPLESFDLYDIQSITDASVQAFGQLANTLGSLCLQGCLQLTIDGNFIN